MPSLREHCKQSLDIYGVSGEEIHKWMDEPVKLYGGTSHRNERHDKDQDLPVSFIKKYGTTTARNIMLDHLLLDSDTITGGILLHKESKHKQNTIFPKLELEIIKTEVVEPIQPQPQIKQTVVTGGTIVYVKQDIWKKIRELGYEPKDYIYKVLRKEFKLN